MNDRMVARARQHFEASEALQGSATGQMAIEGKRRMVAVLVTDRRILIAGRGGHLYRDLKFTGLSSRDLVESSGALHLGPPDDRVIVTLEPSGQAAVLALIRERLS